MTKPLVDERDSALTIAVCPECGRAENAAFTYCLNGGHAVPRPEMRKVRVVVIDALLSDDAIAHATAPLLMPDVAMREAIERAITAAKGETNA